MKSSFLYVVAIAVALETIADIFFKRWVLEHKNWFVISGMVIYAMGTALWAFSLRFESLSKAIAVFTVLNLIAVALAGVFIFGESLSTTNKIGIAIGILSVILIEAF